MVSPAPPSLAVPSQQLLNKFQAPIDTLTREIDRLLVQTFHFGAWALWALHLCMGVLWTVALSWLAGWGARKLGRRLEQRGSRLPAAMFKISAGPLRWVVLLAGLSDTVSDAWPVAHGLAKWVSGLLFVMAAFVGVRGTIRLARTAIAMSLRPAVNQAKPHDPTFIRAQSNSNALVPLLQRLASLVMALLGLLVVLHHFGQNVSSVVAALGVTSLAIGLAAQQALSNFIAGLVLVLDRPFRIGDRVRIRDAEAGEVLEIGLRSTQVRLADGTTLVVPNADLVATRLVNQTGHRAVRAEARLNAPLTTNMEELTQRLLAASQDVEMPEPVHPARVMLLGITDKLDVSLSVWLPRSVITEVPLIEESLRRAALRALQSLTATPAAAPTAAAPANPAGAGGPADPAAPGQPAGIGPQAVVLAVPRVAQSATSGPFPGSYRTPEPYEEDYDDRD